MYATLASKGNERIRIGEGLPDETTPPPPKPECQACLEGTLCTCLRPPIPDSPAQIPSPMWESCRRC